MKKLLFVVGILLMPITSNADVTIVTFDHTADKQNIQSIDVSEGSFFEVDIINTCPDKFQASSIGLELKKPSTDTNVTTPTLRGTEPQQPNVYHMEDYIINNGACVIGEPIVLKIPHDPKYGGYQILIAKSDKTDQSKKPITAIKYKDGQTKDSINKQLDQTFNTKCKDASDQTKCANDINRELIAYIEQNIVKKDLNETYLVVQVNESPWHFDFAGGFTFSFLTDQKFGVDSNNVVYRNKSAEDLANLGFAAFLHTYNDRWKIPILDKLDLTFVPISLGLGITTGSKVSYFFGPSLKLGKAFLTLGWNIGPTQSLPAGINEGSQVTDANALNNMGTRTGGGFFFALSYTFLGSSAQTIFQKPFATPAVK
jgi:hypothetical protein